MAANEILNFCQTNTGTNLLTQAEYLASLDRRNGNTQFTIAISKLVNKALAQTCSVSSGLAQFVANNQNVDVTDQLLTAGMSDVVTHAIANYIRNNIDLTFIAGGTSNAITINTSPFLYPDLVRGMQIQFIAESTTVNGAVSLQLDGGVVTRIVTRGELGVQNVRAGEIVAGAIYKLLYDGVDWIILNPTLKNINFIGVGVLSFAVQTIPGTNTPTKIIYSPQPQYDTNSFWNPTTQLLTVPFSGYYEMTASTFFKPLTAGANATVVYTAIEINGVITARLGEIYSPSNSTVTNDVTSTGDYKSFLNAGAQVALYAACSNAPRNVGAQGELTFFQITYLGS
jgi:hypothetical protein